MDVILQVLYVHQTVEFIKLAIPGLRNVTAKKYEIAYLGLKS